MASFTLPYFADEAILPAPLPTAEAIEAATETLNERVSETSGKVVGVGDHFVVKYSISVNLQEGQTMRFLERSSAVPVPCIYALYQKLGPDDDTYSYIVMERIRGPTLASVWSDMGQMEKETVALKLRRVFEEMRRLESPGGYCSIGRHGLTDSLLDSGDDSASFNGPFDTESDLNEAMIARYAIESHSKHKTRHFSRAFKDIFQNHASVFTHVDFQRKNVMLRMPTEAAQDDLEQWSLTDLELVVIDWEFAGWYPGYWEYSRALFGCGAWRDDWSDLIEEILEPRRSEYAWLYAFWSPYV